MPGFPDSLSRPVALVTGCSSGIGLRAVPELVRRGFHVVATMRDLSRRQALDDVTDDHVTVLPLDVLRQETIDDCVATTLAATGRIDVLVNNAGIARPHFVEEAPLDEWRSVFETNLFGQVAVTNAVLPAMRAQGNGRILMLSSIGSRVPSPLLGVYCASKSALEAYAETLQLEAAPFGVRVFLLRPGAYRTEIYNDPLLDAEVPTGSAYADQFAVLQAFYKRYVTTSLRDPDEVARAIGALASRDARGLHYPVGTDAWMKRVMRVALPWRSYQSVARRLVGLSG